MPPQLWNDVVLIREQTGGSTHALRIDNKAVCGVRVTKLWVHGKGTPGCQRCRKILEAANAPN